MVVTSEATIHFLKIWGINQFMMDYLCIFNHFASTSYLNLAFVLQDFNKRIP